MKRPLQVLAALLLALPLAAAAQDLLIRDALVHTASARGSLEHADVLVRQGRIAAVGTGLAAGGAAVVEAQGRALTPALFAGITDIGLEEVSAEASTRDAALTLGADARHMAVRPEFDVTLAYNPASILLPIARVEGLGFSLLDARSAAGGSIIGGQGGVVRFDGGPDPIGPRSLFLSLGSDAAELSGSSRAGQWLLLEQLEQELRGRIGADSPQALLLPAGRQALAGYFERGGRMVVRVERAADIRQLLRWAAQRDRRIAIVGGAEAWRLAPELAAAKVPVFVDPLANLPADFDRLGARMDNAALLVAAGVAVGFSQSSDASHNARKIRQLAGNAVANGLSWQAGLAGLTRIPAETFGVADQIGTIEPGKRADLVLWNGDPLDVAHTADQLWLDGRAIPMRSRQTKLRDRYLGPTPRPQAGELPRAYSARRD